MNTTTVYTVHCEDAGLLFALLSLSLDRSEHIQHSEHYLLPQQLAAALSWLVSYAPLTYLITMRRT